MFEAFITRLIASQSIPPIIDEFFRLANGGNNLEWCSIFLEG
jgi:hypothetical protein